MKRHRDDLPYYILDRKGNWHRIPYEPYVKPHPPMLLPEWWYFDYKALEEKTKEIHDSFLANSL